MTTQIWCEPKPDNKPCMHRRETFTPSPRRLLTDYHDPLVVMRPPRDGAEILGVGDLMAIPLTHQE